MATLVAALFASVADAKTLKFPSEAPVAKITIPDSWGPKETESGVDATSADSAIYISVDVAKGETSDKVIDDAFEFLKTNGVEIDATTQKTSDDTVNDLKMSNFDWDGKDADGPVSVGLSLIATDPDTLLVITYWGSKGTQEAHAAELGAIINSLKAVKG